jgi:glutamate carboxypeptidase
MSDERLTAAVSWIRSQRDAMESLLRALVEQSSWTSDKAGVDAAQAILRANAPGRTESVASERFGDHLVVHAGRPASDGGVVLIGHMDTVFPRETFSGYRVEGDTARGPGVLDMKGGLVIATFALRALEVAGALGEIAATLISVSDEEVGSPDSAEHIRRIARGARAALGFESGRAGDAVVTQRKGTGSFTVAARGKAAHAGNAHADGANAIWALSRFVDRAQQLTDYARGVTINIGRIAGGIGKNTVPDAAEAQGDLRFVRRADESSLRESLLRIAEESVVAGTRLEIAWGAGRPPLERTDASEALRDAYLACQRDAGLGAGEVPLQGGGSDAATTSSIGIPSIDGLGIRGDGFHTLDERADLASLVPKAEAVVRFLMRTR